MYLCCTLSALRCRNPSDPSVEFPEGDTICCLCSGQGQAAGTSTLYQDISVAPVKTVFRSLGFLLFFFFFPPRTFAGATACHSDEQQDFPSVPGSTGISQPSGEVSAQRLRYLRKQGTLLRKWA